MPDKHSYVFGIYTGYSRHNIRDEAASPLIYSGRKAPFEFSCSSTGSKDRQSIDLIIDNPELHSSITDKTGNYLHFADNFNIVLDYSFNRRAFAINPIKTACFLGLKLLNVLNYRNFHYYNGNSIIFLEQFNSLGLNFLFEKNLGPAHSDLLRFNINVPVISYVLLGDRYNAVVSDTFNKIDFNKNVFWQAFTNGEFVSFNKLLEYQTNLSYSKFLTKHVGFEFAHQFHFYYFSQYKDLLHTRYINNQFLIGLILRI
jgi:hypothetical protein